MPPAAAHLWTWFWRLHRGRTTNGLSPNRASHLDLLAWKINEGISLKPWEADALMRLGDAWVREQNAPPMIATAPPPSGPRIRHRGRTL